MGRFFEFNDAVGLMLQFEDSNILKFCQLLLFFGELHNGTDLCGIKPVIESDFDSGIGKVGVLVVSSLILSNWS
jgi:hypothetical protein